MLTMCRSEARESGILLVSLASVVHDSCNSRLVVESSPVHNTRLHSSKRSDVGSACLSVAQYC